MPVGATRFPARYGFKQCYAGTFAGKMSVARVDSSLGTPDAGGIRSRPDAGLEPP